MSLWPPQSLLRHAASFAVTPDGFVIPAVFGACSWYGGQSDGGVTATERGAISGLVLRGNTDFYCAMRWDYTQGPWSKGIRAANRTPVWTSQVADRAKRYLKDQSVVVYGPRGSVVCRVDDWGPNKLTGRTIDLSPAAMKRTGATTDSVVVTHWRIGSNSVWSEKEDR